MSTFTRKFVIAIITIFAAGIARAQEARLKDLVSVRGVRSNQLTGFGVVVGLSGTGDSIKSLNTLKASANMMTRLGMTSTPTELVPGAMAAVIVTAELPPFARNGDRVDVKISKVGDAKSLAGGTLITTPLRAGDGNVYVLAQGSVVVGQASGEGPRVLSVANVPNGGTVEKEFAPDLSMKENVTLSLRQSDFTTNVRIVDAINEHLRGFYATSQDPTTIQVKVPEMFSGKFVEFISEIESIRVTADAKSVVVMNERTGTVVMGNDVVVSPVSISHGELSIQVGQGKSGKGAGQGVVNLQGSTVGKLVETLNALGVKPADLVGIMQTLNASGALKAELRFM